MEPISILPLSLAALLASFSGPSSSVDTPIISMHTQPEIAGLWELDRQETEILGQQLMAQEAQLEKISKDLLVLLNEDELSSETGKVVIIDGAVLDTRATNTDMDNLDDRLTVNGLDRTNGPKTGDSKASLTSSTLTPKPLNPSCRERYQFGEDNKLVVTSGAEWSYGEYLYHHGEDGLPMIALRTTYDNNEMDCAGLQVDQAGQTLFAFVDYQPENNKMRWCVDKAGEQCFMSLRRLLP